MKMRPGREQPSETTEVKAASEENSQLGQMKISCAAGESLPGERDYTQPQNSKVPFGSNASKILRRIKVSAHSGMKWPGLMRFP